MEILEKTRTVSLNKDELRKILGVKDNEELYIIRNPALTNIPLHTVNGKQLYSIMGDIVFTIVEPVESIKGKPKKKCTIEMA